MTLNEIYDYCMAKAYAWYDMPFGNGNILIKISTHYFVTLFELKGKPAITVKCNPEQGVEMRELFPDSITRGWHCPPVQQPYNNTIDLNGNVPDAVILKMIDDSYDYVFNKLTNKERAKLLTNTEI